jgi:DNA-binding transcriptional regulator YdaS (Cro superfamily)
LERLSCETRAGRHADRHWPALAEKRPRGLALINRHTIMPGMKRIHTRNETVERVIRALGGVRKASEALYISMQAVSKWKRIPNSRIAQIEHLTGIPRHEIRPDIYGASADASRKSRAA